MAKRSVEVDTNFANNNTYLLNKVGLIDEAKAQKSMELAPEAEKSNLWSREFLSVK